MSNYYTDQLGNTLTRDGDFIDIKVKSPAGETNWLRFNKESAQGFGDFTWLVRNRQRSAERAAEREAAIRKVAERALEKPQAKAVFRPGAIIFGHHFCHCSRCHCPCCKR